MFHRLFCGYIVNTFFAWNSVFQLGIWNILHWELFMNKIFRKHFLFLSLFMWFNMCLIWQSFHFAFASIDFWFFFYSFDENFGHYYDILSGFILFLEPEELFTISENYIHKSLKILPHYFINRPKLAQNFQTRKPHPSTKTRFIWAPANSLTASYHIAHKTCTHWKL